MFTKNSKQYLKKKDSIDEMSSVIDNSLIYRKIEDLLNLRRRDL